MIAANRQKPQTSESTRSTLLTLPQPPVPIPQPLATTARRFPLGPWFSQPASDPPLPLNKGSRHLNTVFPARRIGIDFFQHHGKAAKSPNPRLRATCSMKGRTGAQNTATRALPAPRYSVQRAARETRPSAFRNPVLRRRTFPAPSLSTYRLSRLTATSALWCLYPCRTRDSMSSASGIRLG